MRRRPQGVVVTLVDVVFVRRRRCCCFSKVPVCCDIVHCVTLVVRLLLLLLLLSGSEKWLPQYRSVIDGEARGARKFKTVPLCVRVFFAFVLRGSVCSSRKCLSYLLIVYLFVIKLSFKTNKATK